MNYNKSKLLIPALLILVILSLHPASAATLEWHSSISEGAAWKWKVSNYSGEITTIFGSAYATIEEGTEIKIEATGNPPTVGDWGTLVMSTSIAWADLYVNGTKITGENTIYFFVSPLLVGNTTPGWENWVNTIYLITAWLGGSNFDSSNSTSGDLKTYECSNNGGTGPAEFSTAHEMTYNIKTGILERYTYDFSNTSLSSSVTFTRAGGGLLDDLGIPGFESITAIAAFGAIILILTRRKE